MPKPETDARYVRLIYERASEGKSAVEISREIEESAQREPEGWKDAPLLRTVQRIHARWKNLSDDQRLQYGRFEWPASMVAGLLPWEASRAGLDLLRIRLEDGRSRPSVQEVRWFWRLRLASPSLPTRLADWWASDFAAREFIATQRNTSVATEFHVEVQLAFEPWARAENATGYATLAEREGLVKYNENELRSSRPFDAEAARRFNESQRSPDMAALLNQAYERIAKSGTQKESKDNG